MTQKEIVNEILNAKKEFITDSYSMSIGELMSMYKDDELKINPKFQREFRWTLFQQSKLIESVLIGIPLTSFFVYQNKEGVWEVVDGVQRISTFFQFLGILKDKDGNILQPSKLTETKTLKSIEGLTWELLPTELQLDFKRARIELKIIKYISDKNAMFEVFQRLNYRPTILSGQEYRNALFIMSDEHFYNWLIELAEEINFRKCIEDLGERWFKEKYHQELILRLFIFPNYSYKSKHQNVDDYLDDSIFYDDNSLLNKIQMSDFDYVNEKMKFVKTFDLLYKSKGENVFKRTTGRSGQQFLESYYEAIAIGLYHNIDSYADTEDDIKIIKDKIDNLENEEEFKKNKGSSTNTEIRIKKLVPFGKKYFEK